MVALMNSSVVAESSWDWRGVTPGWQESADRRIDLPHLRISLSPALPAMVADDELEDAERWDGLS